MSTGKSVGRSSSRNARMSADGGATARAATRARSAPGGEVLPRRRLVRELDPLAGAGEDHGVLADDVAAAQRGEADRAFLARAQSRLGAP